MAITITSFLPTGGPTTGGTKVVIVGTGLDTVDDVEFGNVPGVIDTTAVNTATSLTVLAPAIANDGTLVVKITLIDNAGSGVIAVSTSSYTYTVVTSPVLSTALAAKWAFEVDTSVAQDGSAWTKVRGVTNFQPAVASTTQDDSDYDSVDPVTGISWGSDVVTQLKWSLVVKLDRKTAAGYVEDPGQAQIRSCYDKAGADSVLHARWYDRNGSEEAYEGSGLVQWSDDGGDLTALSTVSVTVMGRGLRKTITNPAA